MKTRINLVIMSVFLIYGCGKGDLGKDAATIDITPSDLIVKIPEAVVDVGQTYEYVIRVHNIGTIDLQVNKVTSTYTACDNDTEDAITLDKDTEPYPVTLIPYGSGGGSDELVLKVHYKRPAKTCAGRKLNIVIENTSSNETLRLLNVEIDIEKAVPKIGAIPSTVDFGQMAPGTTGNVDLGIKNISVGKLLISKMIYRADSPGFSFMIKLPNKEKQIISIPTDKAGTMKFDPPVELWDYEVITFNMVYKAASSDPATGQMIFISNDENYPAPDGFEVPIQANVGGPCLKAEPASVDFGAVTKGNLGVEVVKLSNCGDKSVSITSIALDKNTSKDFSLDLSGFDNEPSESAPVVIQPKVTKKLVVTYKPLKVDKDANGGIIPDTGSIVIDNSSPLTPLTIGLKGMGVDASAPVADFTMEARICNPPNCSPLPSDLGNCVTKVVKDGDTVPPQTNIQMHDLSNDPTPGGGIMHWQWGVAGPPDSGASYIPTSEFPEPQICLNVAGDYNFLLTVLSKSGVPSQTTQKGLKVSSGDGLHIELTWHTPNDPDETDQCGKDKDCGSDMDLHFLHPNAYGQGVDITGVTNPGYFAHAGGTENPGWDCYWNNAHPLWVKPDQAEPGTDPNPNLDRDDTDGLGPENLNLKDPQVFQNDACYRVGVHYFSDHGFGASFATVKVYVNGILKWQNPQPVRMDSLDLWDVAEICWSKTTKDIKIVPEKGSSGQPYVIYPGVNAIF